MTRTEWIIKVLRDSFNEDISLENKLWLTENVEKLHIMACVEDCVCNTFDIAKSWPKKKKKNMLIQNGKHLHFKADFNPLKEALLLTVYDDSSYLIFLYSPKQFEENK